MKDAIADKKIGDTVDKNVTAIGSGKIVDLYQKFVTVAVMKGGSLYVYEIDLGNSNVSNLVELDSSALRLIKPML